MPNVPLKLIFFITLQAATGYLVCHFYRRFQRGKDQVYFFALCATFLVTLVAVLYELSSYLDLGAAWPEVAPAALAIAIVALILGANLDRTSSPPSIQK